MDRHLATPAADQGFRIFERARNRVIALGVISVSAVAALAGCAPAGAEEEPRKPTAAHSAEASPIPESSEVPATEMPEKYDFGVTWSEIQSLQPLTIEQLTAQDENVRAQYALGVSQQYDIADFSRDYASITENPQDMNLPAVISSENTPEQAWALIGSMRFLGLTIPGSDGQTLDAQAAKKMALTTFIDGSNSALFQNYSSFVDEVIADGPLAATGRSLAASHIGGDLTVNSSSELYTDNAGRACRDTNITDGRVGVTTDLTICLIGQPGKQIWATKG